MRTMYKIPFILLVGIAFSLPSCKKIFIDSGDVVIQERSLDLAFTSIFLEGNIDLEIDPEDNNTLRVEAGEKLLPYLQTEVYEDELHIYLDANSLKNHGKTTVTIGKQLVEKISASGSGDVTAYGIEGSHFVLIQTGSGDSDLDVGNREYVAVNTQGSGDAKLWGDSPSMNINTQGSGDVFARELNAEEINMSMTGSGDVEVTVSEKLVGLISGSGDLRYWGDPAIVEVSESGSGDLEQQ